MHDTILLCIPCTTSVGVGGEAFVECGSSGIYSICVGLV